jgi:hypothetical protein
MRETILMSKIRAVLCRRGSPVRLWRNNVGVLPDGNGGRVAYGLGKGSSDLVGLIVGQGRFLGVEIKRPNQKPTAEQEAWLKTIRDFGGIAVVLRSVEEAEELLRRILDGSI